MALAAFLESLERENQERFRQTHRMGLRGFFQMCQNPQVSPYDEQIGGGIKTLIDRCATCGRTQTTNIPLQNPGI